MLDCYKESCCIFNWDLFHHIIENITYQSKAERQIMSFPLLEFQIKILCISLLLSQTERAEFWLRSFAKNDSLSDYHLIQLMLWVWIYFKVHFLKKNIKRFNSCLRLKNLMIFFKLSCYIKSPPTAVFLRSSKMVLNVLSVTFSEMHGVSIKTILNLFSRGNFDFRLFPKSSVLNV